MPKTPLEKRIVTLEQQMREVIEKIQSSHSPIAGRKDWRKSLGMFDNHPLMKEIDEEGQRIRQADREKVPSDHS